MSRYLPSQKNLTMLHSGSILIFLVVLSVSEQCGTDRILEMGCEPEWFEEVQIDSKSRSSLVTSLNYNVYLIT